MIIKSDYRIPSAREGCEVLLRNKHLSDAEHTELENAVLFVHGATYGSTHTFDYPIDGESWMDMMAGKGFDAWGLDLLGYGASDRPGEMSAPPEENDPIVDTRHAVREVDRAVNFILEDRGIDTINLIGYSWGTAICGTYAGDFPEKVNRLVLSGALWVEKGNEPRSIASNPGAYRMVDVESAMSRWAIGRTDEEIDAIVPRERRLAWCEHVIGSDPESGKFDPPQMKAPAGVVKDFMHYAATGEPWYAPEKIQAPTQIVVAELDRETTPGQGREVFKRLTNAAEKRMTVIGNGTHSLLLENNRHQLHNVVSSFLLSP